MITQIAITFGVWLILLWVSINLIGMLVRGLVLASEMKKILAKGGQVFGKIATEFYKPSEEKRANLVVLVFITMFLGVLYYFWNIGVVITTTLIMVARIPDLLWEVRHGGVCGTGLLKRTDLANKVIEFAEKNGIDTKNPTDATLLGEFVVSLTREGKVSRSGYAEMSPIYMLTIFITLATLPMLWYALYQLS